MELLGSLEHLASQVQKVRSIFFSCVFPEQGEFLALLGDTLCLAGNEFIYVSPLTKPPLQSLFLKDMQ